MIHKNVKISKVKCDTVEFGHGSVQMQPAILEGKPVLMFRSNLEGHEVGEENGDFIGKTSDEFKPEIVFVFNNQAGMNALIQSIEDCRKHFESD